MTTKTWKTPKELLKDQKMTVGQQIDPTELGWAPHPQHGPLPRIEVLAVVCARAHAVADALGERRPALEFFGAADGEHWQVEPPGWWMACADGYTPTAVSRKRQPTRQRNPGALSFTWTWRGW